MKRQHTTKIPVAAAREERYSASYEQFLRSLQLLGLAVSEGFYRVDREAYFGKESQKQVVEVDAEVEDLSDDYFDLSASLRLSIRSEDEEADILAIKATYLMHIHAKPRVMKEEYVKRFAKREFRLIVWPYLREFVTSACNRMYVPPIFLPLPGSESQDRAVATAASTHEE